MLATLREDFTRLPALLAEGAPEQPLIDEVPELIDEPAPAESSAKDGSAHGSAVPVDGDGAADQLGLF
jgi:hypothetical protein